MNVERLKLRLQKLAENSADSVELGRLAREVGHSLSSASLQELREFRAESAAVRDALEGQSSETAFLKGLLFGLAEVSAAYEAEAQAVAEREQLARFLRQEVHFGLLCQLADGPRLPRELARALSTSDAQVSRALRDLRAVGLVDLTPPTAFGDQRTRPHRLTAEGRALLMSVQNEAAAASASDRLPSVERRSVMGRG